MASSATARADAAGRCVAPAVPCGRAAGAEAGGATVVPTGAEPDEPGSCIGWASNTDGTLHSKTSNMKRKGVAARVVMRQSKSLFDLRMSSQRLFWMVPSIRKLKSGQFDTHERVQHALGPGGLQTVWCMPLHGDRHGPEMTRRCRAGPDRPKTTPSHVFFDVVCLPIVLRCESLPPICRSPRAGRLGETI